MARTGFLRTQFLLIAILMVVGLGAVLLLCYQIGLRSEARVEQLAQHNIPVVKAVEAAEHRLTLLQWLIRGASETRNQAYLFELQSLLPKLSQSLQQVLQQQAVTNFKMAELQQAVQGIEGRVKQFVAAEVSQAPVGQTQIEQRSLEAIYLKKQLNYIQTLLRNFKQQLMVVMDQQQQRVQAELLQWQVMAMMVSAVVLGVVLILGLTLLWRIRRHVVSVTQALQAIAMNEGVVNRVPECHVPDEIGGLVSAFNQVMNQLRQMSAVDKLTGVKNLANFSYLVSQRLDQYAPDQGRISLLVIDIDYLKRHNDENGYLAGNQILHCLGSFLRQYKPKDAEVGRCQGGSFVMLLPRYHLHQAQVFAEQLRQDIERMPVQVSRKLPQYIKVSIGIAEYKPGEAFRTLMKRANDALFEAKENGRNRIELLR